MALRFLEQGGELLRELRAQGAVEHGDPCPMLCIVLHNGRSRWTAPTSAAALVNLPPAMGEAPAVPGEFGAFYPWGYWPLDFAAYAGQPHVPGNVMSMIIGIDFARRRSDLVAPLWETARNLGDDELGDTVARWLRRLNERYNLELPGMEELLAMQDVTVLTSRLDETIEEWRREAVAEGRDEGLAEGRDEGQRSMLTRMVRQRFGAETAERVDGLLVRVPDRGRLAVVGEWLLEAADGAELEERIASLLREP